MTYNPHQYVYKHISYNACGSQPSDQNRVVITLPNLLKFCPRNLITTRDIDPADQDCALVTISKILPFLAMSPTRQDLSLIHSFQGIVITFHCTNPYMCTTTSLSRSLSQSLSSLRQLEIPHPTHLHDPTAY